MGRMLLNLESFDFVVLVLDDFKGVVLNRLVYHGKVLLLWVSFCCLLTDLKLFSFVF